MNVIFLFPFFKSLQQIINRAYKNFWLLLMLKTYYNKLQNRQTVVVYESMHLLHVTCYPHFRTR